MRKSHIPISRHESEPLDCENLTYRFPGVNQGLLNAKISDIVFFQSWIRASCLRHAHASNWHACLSATLRKAAAPHNVSQRACNTHLADSLRSTAGARLDGRRNEANSMHRRHRARQAYKIATMCAFQPTAVSGAADVIRKDALMECAFCITRCCNGVCMCMCASIHNFDSHVQLPTHAVALRGASLRDQRNASQACGASQKKTAAPRNARQRACNAHLADSIRSTAGARLDGRRKKRITCNAPKTSC